VKKNKNIVKLLVFVASIIVIFIVDRHFGCSKYLSNTENLTFLKNTVDDNMLLAMAFYIIITIIGCVVFALPGVTFAILAGMVFGPCIGIFSCLVATTIGASLAFVVGRFFLKDSIKPMLEKNKILKKLLFSKDGKSDLVVLMITRMLPIFPYNVQNFAYGVTDIGFWKYTIYTFIFMFPGVAFFTIGAAGLTADEDKWIYFSIAGILAVVVTLVGLIIRRKFLYNETEEAIDRAF
jgi:uncharacterized membrane protein YdjX (TVP38/TMEM64 family)